MSSDSGLNAGGIAKRLLAVLTREKQELLLAVPNQKAHTGLRNYCMLQVFLNASLGVSEALALKITDVDWVSGKLDVKGGKDGRDRVLRLNDKELEKLERWQKTMPADCEYVFFALKADPCTTATSATSSSATAKNAVSGRMSTPTCCAAPATCAWCKKPSAMFL